MPGQERGRLRIGGMKRLGRYHDKSWLMCCPTKWQTNMDGHESLHWNWLLLITSEVGIPSCMGSHHTQDRCTSPTPCKTTSLGGDEEMMPQEQDGKVVTQLPTSKASLGWKNGKLWLGLWTSTGASTEDGWRPQVKWFGCRPLEEHVCKAEGRCLYPLMLVDSEPKEECYHSLNWAMAGKANQMKWRGSEMGKQPLCQDGESKVYHSNVKCSYLLRGTYTDYGGIALYPSKQPNKNDSQAEMTEHEAMLLQRIGGVHTDPLKTLHLTINTNSCYTYSKLVMTVVHTRKLLCHRS